MREGVQARRGEDARLAHAAAKHFSPSTGTLDEVRIANQNRAGRRAQSF